MNRVDQGPRLSIAARTDRGRRRELNEDALFAADPCFVVADGMGGHDRGDAAAKAAISAFSEEFTAPGLATVRRVDRALEEARARVNAISARSERGAGCTLTGAILIEHGGVPCWYVLNIGDSRVYLQRGNELRQLTIDHSLREELLAEGDERAAETPNHIITRALGSEDDRHDAWLLPLESGSRLLICSDGLTSELPDGQLRALLSAGGRPEPVVDELIRRALAAGGRDNVTVILVDVISGGIDPASVTDPVEETDGATIEITKPRSR